MRFLHHTPAPPLSKYLHLLWLQEAEVPGHAKERVLPDGSLELVINLREDEIRAYDPKWPERFERLRGAVMCGPHSEFMVIDTEEQALVMGAHFRPGGAFPFLGLPAKELLNLTVSLDDVWGGPGRTLRERLLEAPTHTGRFRIFEAALLSRLRDVERMHPAVAWTVGEIERGPGFRPLMEITNEVGLSSRRFIEVFTREVGLTPKRYERIRRFQRAVQSVHGAEDVHWADVAVSCGYYDQAHFIHDFREFCGLTPAAYFLHRNLRHANHVPLD